MFTSTMISRKEQVKSKTSSIGLVLLKKCRFVLMVFLVYSIDADDSCITDCVSDYHFPGEISGTGNLLLNQWTHCFVSFPQLEHFAPFSYGEFHEVLIS